MIVYAVQKLEFCLAGLEHRVENKYFVDGFKTRELAMELANKLNKEEATRFKRACKCYDCIMCDFDYSNPQIRNRSCKNLVNGECANYVDLTMSRYEYEVEEVELTWE